MRFVEKTRSILKEISCKKHKWKEKARRVCSVMLCASLVAGSMPASVFTAFAADDDETEPDYVYELDAGSLALAVQDAVADGNTLNDELAFRGDAAAEYAELFNPDGTLYELDKDILDIERDADREKDLSLRVFARVTGEISLDERYVIDGSEDILFLLQNKTDEELSAQIYVDGREGDVLTLLPADEIEVDENEAVDSETEADDEESEIIDAGAGISVFGGSSGAGGGAGSTGGSALSGEKKDSDDEADIVIENPDKADVEDSGITEDSDVKVEDKAESDTASEDADASDKDNKEDTDKKDSDAENAADSKDDAGEKDSSDNGKDTSDSAADSGNKDKADSSNEKDTSSNDKGTSGDKDDSKDSSTEKSGSEEKGSSKRGGFSDRKSNSNKDNKPSDKDTASVSYRNGNLLTAAIASESDVEKASPSDAQNSFDGTQYEAVRLGRTGAVAYTTTASDLDLDKAISLLMNGTDSTFPVNTIYKLSITWETSGTHETVYSWTRDNHVTSENNSDQSTIDALVSGSYYVYISFEDLHSDQDLEVGKSYVLALDWPTGEGITVTPGATSGTITSNETEIATWELDPDTGEITITILALTDETRFYLWFSATIIDENEPEPDGDNWIADGNIQKNGEIDELVDDTITYTITAVVPRYTESANGGKAYEWSIDDAMSSRGSYGGDYNNDMSDVEIVLTSTQYPNGIIIPSVENATDEDEYAFYVKVDSDKKDEIIFLNRCSCENTNCADWSDGCGNLYDDTGFCSCWLSVYNATFTITYSVDISEIIQGMEDANTSSSTRITNDVTLYNGPDSLVDIDDDLQYIYRPFTKSETTNPDRNTENKGVGSYKIEISEHDVDYSWADDIEVTDVMDNLALVKDSLTVTVGDTVLTLIDEEEAAKLDKDSNHDKYYSYTYTDVTEDGEMTGGTLVIKIWYPTNQNITIEYQASVISYNTSPTGDYSNSVTVAGTGYTLKGSYEEGSSGQGGSGLTLSMTLTKVDADDNDVLLEGAVFEIYRHVEDDDDILVDTLTTGEDGTFTFESNDDKGYWMDRDVLYYVKEIEAPDGYTPDTTLYGFVFLRNGYEGTYPDGLDPQNVILGEPDGDQIHIEITVENTSSTVKLPKTGGSGTLPFRMAGLLMSTSALYLLFITWLRKKRSLEA